MIRGAESSTSLAIDTSGSFCSVALRRGDGVVFHVASEGGGDHFERLSGLVSGVCDQAGVNLDSLAQIVVGVGPGSFTGLRIGFSFAKGLAVARRLRLVGGCSFLGAAAVVGREYGADRSALDKLELLVVSDARRGEVFLGAYQVDLRCAGVREVEAPRIAPLAEIDRWVERVRGAGGECRVVAPTRGFMPPEVVSLAISEVSRTAEGLLLTLPDNFSELAAQGEPFSLEGVALLEPNYLRSVAAKTIAERNVG